jgi:predicted RNA-binding Zn-ribbon protein involved in translation (DUF1610 family)
MKNLRIILDTVRPPPLGWTWRDDWYSGIDSSFGLLMKFAMLNALSAREIAKVFISEKSGRRSVIYGKPDVDLRDADIFDLDEMSEVFRLPQHQVRFAFLQEILPEGRLRSADTLRWCELCLQRGFHTAVFQVSMAAYCPIHRTAIRSTCNKCKSEIPYRLRTDVFSAPFRCPDCGFDLAPGLRRPRANMLVPRLREQGFVNKLVRFFQFEDRVLTSKFELGKQTLQLAQGEVFFSPFERSGYVSRYLGFVSHVLEEMGFSGGRRQLHLRMEQVERCERGASRALSFEDDDPLADDSAEVDVPLTGTVGSKSDAELHALKTVYRAVRRRLWRRLVGAHRRCVVAAARHLWWRLDGETTASFCPVAEAFIRWRMVWEGCGTPRYLFSETDREMYGIVGWLSARPSPCPSHWSAATQHWVLAHIFSAACIESFRELLTVAQQNWERGKTYWLRQRTATRYDTYWAVGGSDCTDRPTYVFVRSPMPAFRPRITEATRRAHFESHKARLATIYR